MNYGRTIEILQTAAKVSDSGLRKEIESAIALIRSRSDTAEPKPGPNCTYLYDGRLCKGQKGMPECTAGYGYCPLVRKDDKNG